MRPLLHVATADLVMYLVGVLAVAAVLEGVRRLRARYKRRQEAKLAGASAKYFEKQNQDRGFP